MGTRGITEVVFQNQIVVSQYGQWDHYPMGQGLDVLNFLRDLSNIEKLKRNLPLVYEVSGETIDLLYRKHGNNFETLYPSLTRDVGAKVLEIIANAETKVPFYLDKDFKTERLFCEGVFEINLDEQTFTTRTNRYKNPLNENVLTLSFLECLTIDDHEYLTRAKCGAYAYKLENAQK